MKNLTFFNNTFSISFLFKVLFIIFLILITIFLISQELKIRNEKQKLTQNPVMASSSFSFKTFRDIAFIIVPGVLTYKVFRDQKEKESFNLNRDNSILKVKREYETFLAETNKNDIINGTKFVTHHANYFSNFLELQENFKELQMIEKEINILKDIENINELKIQKELGNVKSNEDTSLISWVALIKSSLNLTHSQYDGEIKERDENFKAILDTDKSSMFNYDKLEEFLNTLTPDEMLAFSGLLLNQLILSHVISIIFILYGDYLIKRFDLENRYPKLAKFIQLRRKLQSYYLKVSITWIILAILPQIFIYSSIILSKLIEFYN